MEWNWFNIFHFLSVSLSETEDFILTNLQLSTIYNMKLYIRRSPFMCNWAAPVQISPPTNVSELEFLNVITGSLNRDDVLTILEFLAKSGNAEPLDKQRNRSVFPLQLVGLNLLVHSNFFTFHKIQVSFLTLQVVYILAFGTGMGKYHLWLGAEKQSH